ncbi:MAG: hypothetical protein E6J36_06100 [Chloroflexi bacterium]|nr:MAG: hypothetical protein E6J36_06100 [Chloroflexota bacterium]
MISLHMIDPTTGWALSEHAVLRTADGGFHWKNVTPPNTLLTRESIADFLTANLAWVTTPQANGATTQVLRTMDSGQTWQQSTIPAAYVKQMTFFDAQRGWILAGWGAGGGAAEAVAVYRTGDGGKTWRNVSRALPASTDTRPSVHLSFGGLKSGIHFLNTSTGWITGTVGVNDLTWLYVSHDGGSTWYQQSLSLPPGVPSAQLSLVPPTFFSATDGILPVIFSDAVMGNGGQSFLPVQASSRSPLSTLFPARSVGRLVGKARTPLACSRPPTGDRRGHRFSPRFRKRCSAGRKHPFARLFAFAGGLCQDERERGPARGSSCYGGVGSQGHCTVTSLPGRVALASNYFSTIFELMSRSEQYCLCTLIVVSPPSYNNHTNTHRLQRGCS